MQTRALSLDMRVSSTVQLNSSFVSTYVYFLAVLLSKKIFFLTPEQILSVHSTLNEPNVEKQKVLKALYRKMLNVMLLSSIYV